MMQSFELLEKKWAEFNNLDPQGMVSCASGTAALHLAFLAHELPQGSEVICPTFTMVACPEAIMAAGLAPVFVDCDSTLNLDVKKVLEATIVWGKALKIGMWPMAYLGVHIYGRRCDMAGLHDIASHYCDRIVIEDLAEAHGVKPHPLTDAACWSFYRNKIIAGQEGGAVWFRDNSRAKIARELRSLGLPGRASNFEAPSPWVHRPRGWNHRLSNIHSQIIIASLESYALNLSYRWKRWEAYDQLIPSEWRMPRPDAPWVYALRIPGMTLDRSTRIISSLCAQGIEARQGFRPCHTMPGFTHCRSSVNGTAAAAFEEVLYLPVNAPVQGRAAAAVELVKQGVTCGTPGPVPNPS